MHIQSASAGAGLLVPEQQRVFVRRLAADVGRRALSRAVNTIRVLLNGRDKLSDPQWRIRWIRSSMLTCA